MDYRGLGSGIIRALKADANIEFRNEASGDQFRAILWRTEQKTTQRAEEKEETEQKTESKEKSSLESVLKSDLKSDLKIVEIFKVNGAITIPEIQNLTGLSRSGVKKILVQLKESGKIRRVGPDKGGHWEVC